MFLNAEVGQLFHSCLLAEISNIYLFLTVAIGSLLSELYCGGSLSCTPPYLEAFCQYKLLPPTLGSLSGKQECRL